MENIKKIMYTGCLIVLCNMFLLCAMNNKSTSPVLKEALSIKDTWLWQSISNKNILDVIKGAIENGSNWEILSKLVLDNINNSMKFDELTSLFSILFTAFKIENIDMNSSKDKSNIEKYKKKINSIAKNLEQVD